MRNALQVMAMAVGIILSSYAINGIAEEEKPEGDEPAIFSKPLYIPIKPALVVNYGGEGKLKYIKVEMSLRVLDTAASNAVRHHLPLIRDYLVRLMSRQNDEDIDTQEAKERLRQKALEGVQNLLMEEDGEQGVLDLFFVHFVVQR
jgi:flagellar FliL protein